LPHRAKAAELESEAQAAGAELEAEYKSEEDGDSEHESDSDEEDGDSEHESDSDEEDCDSEHESDSDEEDGDSEHESDSEHVILKSPSPVQPARVNSPTQPLPQSPSEERSDEERRSLLAERPTRHRPGNVDDDNLVAGPPWDVPGPQRDYETEQDVKNKYSIKKESQPVNAPRVHSATPPLPQSPSEERSDEERRRLLAERGTGAGKKDQRQRRNERKRKQRQQEPKAEEREAGVDSQAPEFHGPSCPTIQLY
jgi:hypothetical protein